MLIYNFLISKVKYAVLPIPMAAQSKARAFGRLPAGIAGSNPARGHECLSGFECCQVEAYASGWSLVQRSPTDGGVCECDNKSSIMRRPWPTGGRGGCRAIKKKKVGSFVSS